MTHEAAVRMAEEMNAAAPAGWRYEVAGGEQRELALGDRVAVAPFFVRRRRDDGAAVRGAADGGLRPERRDAG